MAIDPSPPAPRRDRGDAIPVFLLTGFLGSGKSTLLNHLLASPGMDRTAVLINEFGEVGIDHLIVRTLDSSAVLLKSGCICCTVQGELVDGLKELYLKRLASALPPFDRVVIETTGLADPLPVIACLLRDPLFKHAYRLGGVVTTVDAVHGEGQLDRHPEAVRQAAVADRIVVTKTDLAEPAVAGGLERRLRALNPGAAIIEGVHGEVAPERLLDVTEFDPAARPAEIVRWLREAGAPDIVDLGHGDHAHRHDGAGEAAHAHAAVDRNRHDERIATFCLTLAEPLPWGAFNAWYDEFAERHGDRILRVKGIVGIRGEAAPFVIHCVQSLQHPPTRLPAWPDADQRTRIVFITQDLPPADVAADLREHLGRNTAGTAAPAPCGTPGASAGYWLNAAEQGRVFAALVTTEDRAAAEVLRLMLLTGTGCEEARGARFEDFDPVRRSWRLPLPGGASGVPRAASRRIVLTEAAAHLVAALRERAPAARFVAGGDAPVPLERLRAQWVAAAARAGVAGVGLDDLRPVLAADLFRGLTPELADRLLGLDESSEPPAIGKPSPDRRTPGG